MKYLLTYFSKMEINNVLIIIKMDQLKKRIICSRPTKLLND